MCFTKHATSKIHDVEDLFAIQTMGFRGEALAAIAAIAQVHLETNADTDALGTKVIIEGGVMKSQMAVSIPRGTTVSVKNIFFNVPARRNFLKSDAVEIKHMVDELQRTALARPDIAFSFYQGKTETYQLPTAKLSHRIVHLLGESHKKQLVPCQENTDVVKIEGYIGKPGNAKKTRGEQFFFVNKRFIKSAYLHHAVKRAFEGMIPDNAFPFYVLFFTIDPQHIDVNVHPTKIEVKLDNDRAVYRILSSTVRQALTSHHITPSLDFDQNVNFDPFSISSSASSRSSITEHSYAQFKTESSTKDWESVLEGLKEDTQEVPSTATTLNLASHVNSTQDDFSSDGNTLKVQLHARYILTQIKSGLVLIDQAAAHEQILYEKYTGMLPRCEGATQKLLFPQHVTLNPADFELWTALRNDIVALGFDMDSFGKQTVVVSGCPPEVAKNDPQQLLENVLEQYKRSQLPELKQQEKLARILAKRACIQPGKKLMQKEIDSLINQLFLCTSPQYASDGRPIFVTMTLEDIQAMFV